MVGLIRYIHINGQKNPARSEEGLVHPNYSYDFIDDFPFNI